MSWLDNLRPASFRGVPFFIETSKRTLGRRVVVHEFPNRDTPYTQDMGRISDSFDIDGHVLGNDYDVAKKKLEQVFNKSGPGELVHPYYGLMLVQVGAVEFSESTKEGAILYFTATFKEAGSNEFPKSINDKASILGEAADKAIADAKSEFDNTFSVAGLPGFAVDSARAKIAAAQKAYADASKGVSDVSNAAAQLAFSTRNLVAETNDLLQSPSNLSQALLNNFGLLQSAISNARVRTKSLTSFFNFGSDDVGSNNSTPIRQQESANKDSFNNLMRRAAAIYAAVDAQQATYESFQDAEAQRQLITDVIEEQIRLSGDSEIYQTLIDVNAALVAAVPDVDADLPSLKKLTLDETTSSLELAYDLFEDGRTEADIIARNKIQNPGFIVAGTELEVLDGNV